MKIALLSLLMGLAVVACHSQQNSTAANEVGKPRVFITDSESWEMHGGGGGNSSGFGGATSGGARPQTAEIIKTFGERCPSVTINNIQGKADYIVVLDHEGGKGALRHKNKMAVFARVSGDAVASKSTLSLGGSVQSACEAISTDWSTHGAAIRAAQQGAESKTAAPAPQPAVLASSVAPTGKVSVTSVPDGADIELDGSFVGNTPSDIQVSEGDHSFALRKTGYKTWERKFKVTSGSSIRLNATLENSDTQ